MPMTEPSASLATTTTLSEQIVQWATHRIQEQVFRPGMRMPSVRQLAVDRGVSRFTVVEAYDRLVARGYLQARQGSGFFVRERANKPLRRAKPAALPARPIDMGWLVRNMQSGIAADMSPGFGYLPPELCGGELMRAGLRSVSTTAGLQLSHTALAHGYTPLREQLSRKLEEMEIASTPAQILTTSGSTQAIDLVVRHFLQAGDTVIVGDPAWSAQLASLTMVGVNVVGMPYTAAGPDVKALAELAATHKPKMLLVNTPLHNPTGTLLTVAAAYQILRIAEAHDMVVVEDDIYADFLPSGVQYARLASLDQLKRVVYVGSFSKTLVPGIRVGYLAGSADLVESLAGLKLLTSFATPEINERIVYQTLTQGSYRKHCQRMHGALDALREPAFKRCEAMGLKAFCRPLAGFLGWFDTGVDTASLAAMGLEAGYLLAPGAIFSPQQTPSTWMRINIATSQNPAMLKWMAKTLEQLRGA
ncbi:PLP-dependent aminotransferase family protein [Rhodoferax sp. AJA081-3]|uniref:aminotransferase-like domain-containing protein n=1 Tax=Rhodoferax sp. AJA081-3 TaxID=2752316 RepID=UPI001AE0E806|nr:PLP-dependent aminotransferase family protein [Rhodoferax sp. AJA081-3]QTN29097.1 PLP-dependent aminotransferase family protein [Rhodoferax sp. AJA081-3]